MGNSSCDMYSFFPSSKQQGDSIPSFGESVSFGRFIGQTLEWDKFSAFNQNRYLEEAQRLAKPGLVAQRKALFEAHFKKPAPNLDTKNEVPVLRSHDNKENLGEPCKDMCSVKSRCAFYTNAAMSNKDVLPREDHPKDAPLVESDLGESYCNLKNGAIAVNNTTRVILVGTDGPGSGMSGDTSDDLEVHQHLDSPCEASSTKYMAVEPKSFIKIDPIDGLKTELNQSEVVDISPSSMAISQDKIAVQEPIDNLVLASTFDSKQASTTSVKKPVAGSPFKLVSQAFQMKENNAPENSKTSGIGFVKRKRIVTKPLHLPFNQSSSLRVTKKSLTAKKLDNVKYPVNSVRARGSKEHSDQVMADLEGQVNTTTSSETLSTNRKSSAKPDLRPALPLLKKKMNITRKNRTSITESAEQKATSEWKTPAFLLRTGTKSVSTSVAAPKTFSRHAPTNQVLSDTNMRKHAIPSSNTAVYIRKPSVQSHAISVNKTGCRVIQMNSALALSQNNLKKSMPKAVHMSDGPSSNFVTRSTTTPNCRSSRNKAFDGRESKESSANIRKQLTMQESLQKSMQTSATLQFNGKGSERPITGLNELSNGIRTAKKFAVPPTTVFIPFRFRSDERAAKRQQKLEDRSSVETKNPLRMKRKVPATTKGGSAQVTQNENQTSATCVTSLISKRPVRSEGL